MAERNTDVPQHLGIIMDGNRRWAKAHGLPSIEGHVHGQDVLQQVSKQAFEQGVQYVSAYVFSTENWQRSKKEVAGLMRLVQRAMRTYLDEFHTAGIRLQVLGQREGLDAKTLATIEAAEQKTRHNTRGTLALCFNYGGQQEIVDAVRSIVEKSVSPAEITPEGFVQYLYAPEVPPVDLLVRTGGEQRISGYMLFRAAYAELYFTDVFWPDFNGVELQKALTEYNRRQRRFGK